MIANSRAVGTKRKEAQKMAQWALNQTSVLTARRSTIENNEELIDALEGAFANLDVKSI